ncbi:MAG: RDD family protein [Lysobacteraceae bacterium]|nr:RDD family protein [Xanthomonadaceae bacterium]HRX99575.1 RDD family protein [Xanthomonadaceae bacterium]
MPLAGTAAPSPDSPAGFWKRYAAYFIDWLLLSVASNLLLTPVSLLYMPRLKALMPSAQQLPPLDLLSLLWSNFLWPLTLWSIAAWVLLAFPYFTILESSKSRGSLGKQALGIVVADQRGRPIRFGQASLRFFMTAFSWLTLNLGHAMAAWRRDKRALHDLLAGTTVLNRDPEHPEMPVWAKWMVGLQLGLVVLFTLLMAVVVAGLGLALMKA